MFSVISVTILLSVYSIASRCTSTYNTRMPEYHKLWVYQPKTGKVVLRRLIGNRVYEYVPLHHCMDDAKYV